MRAEIVAATGLKVGRVEGKTRWAQPTGRAATYVYEDCNEGGERDGWWSQQDSSLRPLACETDLVVVITCGLNDERASVAWSVANGGINSGLDVTVFLTSSAVDWVRKGAAELPHLNPLDPPIKEIIQKMMDSGSGILVCPPCAKV